MEGREKVTEWLARLPRNARERYPTPESLVATLITDEVLNSGGFQVIELPLTDVSHGFVNLRQLERGQETKRLRMELGAGGWQIVFPEKAIDTLKKRIDETPP